MAGGELRLQAVVPHEGALQDAALSRIQAARVHGDIREEEGATLARPVSSPVPDEVVRSAGNAAGGVVVSEDLGAVARDCYGATTAKREAGQRPTDVPGYAAMEMVTGGIVRICATSPPAQEPVRVTLQNGSPASRHFCKIADRVLEAAIEVQGELHGGGGVEDDGAKAVELRRATQHRAVAPGYGGAQRQRPLRRPRGGAAASCAILKVREPQPHEKTGYLVQELRGGEPVGRQARRGRH